MRLRPIPGNPRIEGSGTLPQPFSVDTTFRLAGTLIGMKLYREVQQICAAAGAWVEEEAGIYTP
jgi:3-methyladenine DNA glycosylase Mpg